MCRLESSVKEAGKAGVDVEEEDCAAKNRKDCAIEAKEDSNY